MTIHLKDATIPFNELTLSDVTAIFEIARTSIPTLPLDVCYVDGVWFDGTQTVVLFATIDGEVLEWISEGRTAERIVNLFDGFWVDENNVLCYEDWERTEW